AKRLHPDRPSGDAEAFRAAHEAHRLLQGGLIALPAPPLVTEDRLSITPLMALNGGAREVMLADGRRIRITLPPGLREGERLRAAAVTFTIAIGAQDDALVRGDDLWITAHLSQTIMADGGRVTIDTPLGRHIVWITRKAAERGLIRLEGQGLPARAGRLQGSLYIRLAAEERPVESSARTLLKRFAAAWAA
ncbi:MAG TPA: DnaJ C-terminal domain-containing protein, partial [Caulobacteraceae bacterium]